jgi:alanine-glyoxylate transaminase/serine-glyoxylate transaminase/serine-pyruvate transaminase
LAGKVWRIGLMGAACTRRNVTLCLSALETTLLQQGASIHAGKALVAADKVYAAK